MKCDFCGRTSSSLPWHGTGFSSVSCEPLWNYLTFTSKEFLSRTYFRPRNGTPKFLKSLFPCFHPLRGIRQCGKVFVSDNDTKCHISSWLHFSVRSLRKLPGHQLHLVYPMIPFSWFLRLFQFKFFLYLWKNYQGVRFLQLYSPTTRSWRKRVGQTDK